MTRKSYLPKLSAAYYGCPPKVYLAGKIRKNCWRHSLVPGLRGARWENAPLREKGFIYVGPFFVSCDHGCYHDQGFHASQAVWAGQFCLHGKHQSISNTKRRKVARACLNAAANADLVFAFIDESDAFGTLVELGTAYEKGVRVVIAFAPGIATAQKNDYWFACSMAYEFHYDVSEADLPDLLNQAIRGMTW